MHDSEKLIKAIGYIDDDIIEAVGRKLGYAVEPPSGYRHVIKVRNVFWAVAILASLLSIVAYATGWFGLSSRITLMESNGGGISSYISMNGYTGTPEAQAHVEWLQFRDNYAKGRDFGNDNDFSWLNDETDLEKYVYIYGAFDQTMMDKLLDIRDKYNVVLHTDNVLPPNNDYFLEITGLNNFVISENGVNDLLGQYVYEDGSFESWGTTYVNGSEIDFALIRGRKGVLDPSNFTISDTGDFEEWQYTTDQKAIVNIAIRQSDGQAYIFFDSEDYIITTISTVPAGNDYKRNGEALAELFDYKELSGGKIDLSSVRNTTPKKAEQKSNLLTLLEWMDTDEYKASSAFQKQYNDYIMRQSPYSEEFLSGYSGIYYYGEFPVGIGEIDRELEAITEQYGLALPGGNKAYWYRTEIPTEKIGPTGGVRDMGEATNPTNAPNMYAIIGSDPFVTAGEIETVISYDTGAFFAEVAYIHDSYYIHYIPKGSFYPLFHAVLHGDCPGWAYDTACGEQVYLTMDTISEYPAYPSCYAIYETDAAYVIVESRSGIREAYLLEMIADDVDFTKFK